MDDVKQLIVDTILSRGKLSFTLCFCPHCTDNHKVYFTNLPGGAHIDEARQISGNGPAYLKFKALRAVRGGFWTEIDPVEALEIIGGS